MNEVFSLSVTVSSVFILSSFHSFFVNQELVVKNAWFAWFLHGFAMHRNSKKAVLKRDVLS